MSEYKNWEMFLPRTGGRRLRPNEVKVLESGAMNISTSLAERAGFVGEKVYVGLMYNKERKAVGIKRDKDGYLVQTSSGGYKINGKTFIEYYDLEKIKGLMYEATVEELGPKKEKVVIVDLTKEKKP